MRKVHNVLEGLEYVGNDSCDRPFNGSKFICIPNEIAEAHHERRITTTQFEMIMFIISRYDRVNIIPPTIKNDYIAKHLNVKKNSVEIMLSTLKKMGFINPVREGKKRYLHIPVYEIIMNFFNNKNQ
jgi:hypothetical protein